MVYKPAKPDQNSTRGFALTYPCIAGWLGTTPATVRDVIKEHNLSSRSLTDLIRLIEILKPDTVVLTTREIADAWGVPEKKLKKSGKSRTSASELKEILDGYVKREEHDELTAKVTRMRKTIRRLKGELQNALDMIDKIAKKQARLEREHREEVASVKADLKRVHDKLDRWKDYAKELEAKLDRSMERRNELKERIADLEQG